MDNPNELPDFIWRTLEQSYVNLVNDVSMLSQEALEKERDHQDVMNDVEKMIDTYTYHVFATIILFMEEGGDLHELQRDPGEEPR